MNKKISFFIAVIIIAAIFVTAFTGLGPIKGAKDIRYGIDIRGGVEAIFVPKDLDRTPTDEELESARSILEVRLDSKNILDREVTIDKSAPGIIIRFPWKSEEKEFDPQKAISELGQTAKLTFRDEEGNILLEGKHVKESRGMIDPQTNKPIVALTFTSEGTKLFSEATLKQKGKRIGIYMDENLISNPVVNEQITTESAQIEGLESLDEAKDIAAKINSGALPFSLETKNYSTISPTLGTNALNIMLWAGLITLILIFLFMVILYRLPGFISCIALLMQLGCQILAISIPQITLTLPGIAGIILSLGMGVDANVIINERIIEEIGKGSTVRNAVRLGYKNAFSAVFDGNITTVFVAVILMIFGSGTMFSFGYTLLVGIILNFVAGVFASQVMLTSITQFKPMQNKALFGIGKDKKPLRFYEKRYIAYIISITIIVAGILASFIGGVSLDTQFTGGTVMKYTFAGDIDVNEVSSVVTEALNRPANAQIATDIATNQKRLVLTLAGNTGITPSEQDTLEETLNTKFSGANLQLSESTMVEPYFGKIALKNSIIAIALAFIMIVVYVWIRFRTISGLSAGVMALIALFHDIFVVYCAFVLMRIPLNDSFVAVVLTIIGYSINDTIVIYDRIRENRRLFPKMGVVELVNKSVTQSITRSVNTAAATAIASIAMLVFAILYGIDSIKLFALPMTVGIISGCYSTICIAGPLWVSWQLSKAKNKAAKAK